MTTSHVWFSPFQRHTDWAPKRWWLVVSHDDDVSKRFSQRCATADRSHWRYCDKLMFDQSNCEVNSSQRSISIIKCHQNRQTTRNSSIILARCESTLVAIPLKNRESRSSGGSSTAAIVSNKRICRIESKHQHLDRRRRVHNRNGRSLFDLIAK